MTRSLRKQKVTIIKSYFTNLNRAQIALAVKMGEGKKKREVSSFSSCDRIKQMYHDLWGRKQTFGIIVWKVCKHSNKITNSYVKKNLSSRALLESLDINLAHLMSKTCFWISNVFLLQEFTLGEKKKKP